METQDINLGVVRPGDEGRQFELRLENQGMRLLFGTVTCADGLWLTFGDAPGATEKHFQFGHDLTLPVRVVGDKLRASNKPLEAHLSIDSNGGAATVTVRAEVPVKPFPAGVLGGAKSPRQVAEKAKANPKEAAALFEHGDVAAWYKSNGWTYPVQGPAASGLAAVQQFFEALGLTPPPKVAISVQSIALTGNPGEPLRYVIEVKTEEKKPVYAHGTSNQPWLEVGRPKINGRTAAVPISVPAVPNKPGQQLVASVTVQSNGNQRFVVPVTLDVAGGAGRRQRRGLHLRRAGTGRGTRTCGTGGGRRRRARPARFGAASSNSPRPPRRGRATGRGRPRRSGCTWSRRACWRWPC